MSKVLPLLIRAKYQVFKESAVIQITYVDNENLVLKMPEVYKIFGKEMIEMKNLLMALLIAGLLLVTNANAQNFQPPFDKLAKYAALHGKVECDTICRYTVEKEELPYAIGLWLKFPDKNSMAITAFDGLMNEYIMLFIERETYIVTYKDSENVKHYRHISFDEALDISRKFSVLWNMMK